MQYKNKEAVVDSIEKNSAKRKRELIAFKRNITYVHDAACKEILLRSAVVFSYAHWEGFVKFASSQYIKHVAHVKPEVARATANFQAIYFQNTLNTALKSTKNIRNHIDVVASFKTALEGGLRFDCDYQVDTESNLNSKVLQNLCCVVGVDYDKFWAVHGPFINELVKNRCAIAHGELGDIKRDYAFEVLDFTLAAIDSFKADIENSIELGAYMQSV